MTRPTFTVTAERGSRRWVLQCTEFPGALSDVTRLDEAEDTIREAIAWVAGVEADSFDIKVMPSIPDRALEHAIRAKRLRETALRDQHSASIEIRQAARILAESEIPLRDIGRILGVSYQRAHQLVSEAEEVEEDPRASA